MIFLPSFKLALKQSQYVLLAIIYYIGWKIDENIYPGYQKKKFCEIWTFIKFENLFGTEIMFIRGNAVKNIILLIKKKLSYLLWKSILKKIQPPRNRAQVLYN